MRFGVSATLCTMLDRLPGNKEAHEAQVRKILLVQSKWKKYNFSRKIMTKEKDENESYEGHNFF